MMDSFRHLLEVVPAAEVLLAALHALVEGFGKEVNEHSNMYYLKV